ncbi:MAG: hypothetical protein H7039_09535, partial [Bryobacteraceae bacterium]|nr:hypothetical protein [Bryobacteraceae bacterium]
SEVVITAAAAHCKALQFSESDLLQAAGKLLGNGTRVRLVQGIGNGGPVRHSPHANVSSASTDAAQETEVVRRAMADPAVQSFREAFPGAEIRQVRNLKE